MSCARNLQMWRETPGWALTAFSVTVCGKLDAHRLMLGSCTMCGCVQAVMRAVLRLVCLGKSTGRLKVFIRSTAVLFTNAAQLI